LRILKEVRTFTTRSCDKKDLASSDRYFGIGIGFYNNKKEGKTPINERLSSRLSV